MSSTPRRHAVAWLGAAVLLAPGLGAVAHASGPAAAFSQPAVTASAQAELPTSWPAVPDVADRLQPWLERTLATAPADAPLRVMVSGETTGAAADAAQAAGLTVQQTWQKVGIVVAAGLPDQVRAVVGQPGVRYVEGDQPMEYLLDTAHTATRSDEALTTYSTAGGDRIDGSGVTVAVIDSGIDGTHPFFTDENGDSKVVRNLENVCVSVTGPSDDCYQDEPSNDTDTNSAGGHGTHVAGIVAGYEVTTADPEGTALRGAAPGAKLVGLSVGAAIGLINANSAMNWVVEHQRNPCGTADEQDVPADPACPPIRATNHSYGPLSEDEEGTSFDESSSTVTLQRALVERGVTPVWAAGNSAGDGGVARTNPPAMDPTPGVLMVASYNDGNAGNRDNQLSGFSSRGKDGDTTTYPDVSAPGDLITSSCRVQLAVCTGSPSYDGGDYQTISGTSMAAPYVAGVVAQLAQADPAITPGEAEDLLEDTAHEFEAGAAYEADTGRNDDSETSFDKGHGLVDVLAVLAAQQGDPVPAEPDPLCTPSSRQVVDPEGDATQIIVADTQANSQPDLDVTEGWLTWDDAAQELTFHITVSDLAGGDGDEYFRFYVTRESDAEVYAVANRDSVGESFSVKQFDAGTSTDVTGAFDEETNEVTIVLPAAQYSEVIPDATLAEGDLIGVGQVLGQRDTGVVTATADTASGSCPFTVAAAEAPTEPTQPPPGGQQPTPRNLDSACPEGRVPASSQTDDDGNFHERAIDCVVWWEIALGRSSNDYDPEVAVSREQMASFVARLVEQAGGELPSNPPDAFDDDGTSHHRTSIDKLAAAGLVDGKGDRRFAPKETVTRAQMAKFIVNAYEHVSPNSLATSNDYFGDDEDDVLEEFINRSAAAGFTAGRNGRYEPRLPVLRDQMASFLARPLDLLVSEGTTPAKQ